MRKILDFENKLVRSVIVIIFFAITLFAVNYIVVNLWHMFGKFFNWFLPFIIAMLLSYMLEPYIKRMDRYLNRHLSSGLILLIINIILMAIIAFSITRLSTEIVELKYRLPYLNRFLHDKMFYFEKGAKELYINLPPQVSEFIQSNMNKIVSRISEFASHYLYILKVIPGMMKGLIIWLISNFIAYLILRDKEKINTFFKNTVAESWQDELKIIHTQIIRAIMGFIKSQIILIVVMFIVSLFGLIVIKSPYIIIISLLAGLFSIIPVIGTGMVFIPFIITKFSTGDISLTIKLTVVYLITIIVREIVMVKVVSQNVGLDILSTIISMYVGIEIFGEFGFIVGPLLLIILKVIFQSSLMDKFREKFHLI